MKNAFRHIQKEITKHRFDYLLLSILSILFLVLLQINKEHIMVIFSIFVAFSVFYIMWGLYHHIKIGNLHIRNIVEYVCFAFIILFIIRLILLIQ